jgi:ferredoxin
MAQAECRLRQVWPNITVKRDPPPDAKDWDGVPEKYQKFFSAEPGQGD